MWAFTLAWTVSTLR
ncbi:hypothetical protein TYRP_004240 [Tyrophagus putrescentiae]|nr:hypothetical protein TYRP_004240 [Tyrophagus putrescentiae]